MGLTAREAVDRERETFTPHPESARYSDIVPFGIDHIDNAFSMGVEPNLSQVYGIQGQGGARKTSLVLNILINQCLSGKLPATHRIIIDTLESGMSVERYLMTLRLIVATKIMIYERWTESKCIPVGMNPREYCWWLFNQPLPDKPTSYLVENTSDMINGKNLTLCVLTMDNIKSWFREKFFLNDKQLYAWDLAGQVVRDFPIEAFGVSEHPDGEVAAERFDDTVIIEEASKRWYAIAEAGGTMQLVVDYMQRYFVKGVSDYYDRMLVTLPYVSTFAMRTNTTVWVISQETIGNAKEFEQTGVVLGGQGGNLLRNDAHTLWRVGYRKDFDKYHLMVYSPVKTRRGNHPDIRLRVEPESGAIFGQSVAVERK